MYVISGPSGAGKGAICAGLAEGSNIMLSVSMTTRAPRVNEKEGISYFFTNRGRFEETIAEGGFFEYAEIYDEYYGTPKAPVLEQLEKGVDVILEIDVNGAAQTKNIVADAVLIFIMPPSPEELRRRIESRGTETPERIAQRLARAESEISQIEKYDYCVINDKLKKAISSVFTIMRAEKLLGGDLKGRILSLNDMTAIRRASKLRVSEGAEKYLKSYKQ